MVLFLFRAGRLRKTRTRVSITRSTWRSQGQTPSLRKRRSIGQECKAGYFYSTDPIHLVGNRPERSCGVVRQKLSRTPRNGAPESMPGRNGNLGSNCSSSHGLVKLPSYIPSVLNPKDVKRALEEANLVLVHGHVRNRQFTDSAFILAFLFLIIATMLVTSC